MDTQTHYNLEAEFECDERLELLSQLDGVFREQPVSRGLWACLWLSDLEACGNWPPLVSNVPVF